MKVKTSELSGDALDWAVASLEQEHDGRLTIVRREDHVGQPVVRETEPGSYTYEWWAPSRIWAQGGPIIEREAINVGTQRNEPGFRPHPDRMWHAHMDTRVYVGYGPTPLIAAMRCYVASRMGDTIEVPDALVTKSTTHVSTKEQ